MKLQALLNEMYEKEETNRRIQDKLRETRKVKLFVQYPESSNLTESKLECSSTLTLKQVTFMAYKVTLEIKASPNFFCAQIVL